MLALFPRVVRRNIGADVANHTVGGKLLSVGTIGVHSCTFGGRGDISSCPCNNNTNVLVRTRPICLTCRTIGRRVSGEGRRGVGSRRIASARPTSYSRIHGDSLRSRGSGGHPLHMICLSPRKSMFGRGVTRRVTRRRSLILLYNRCRKVSRHILRRVIASCISVKSCMLAKNRLPTVIVVSAVSELIPKILRGSISTRFRSFRSGLLRCPRCSEPRR